MNRHKLIELQELRREFYESLSAYWREENFLTFSWWMLLAMLIIPWLVWRNYARRETALRVCMFGFIVVLLNLLGDSLSSNLLITEYPVRLFWFLYPNLFPLDISLLPVLYMYIFQKTLFRPKRYYFLSLLYITLLLAFVIEPLLEYLHIMTYMVSWDYAFALGNYYGIGTVAYLLAQKLLAVQRKYEESNI